ncbi:MAG: chorismate mutase [Pseudomonadota bacterium]
MSSPTPPAPPADDLVRFRKSIDNLDASIVHLLAERFKLTQQVGRLKSAHSLPPSDEAREARQVERLRRLAADAELDPDFAEKFIRFVIKEVIRHHHEIKEEASAGKSP